MAVDFFQNVYCLFVCNFVRIGQLDFSKRGIDLSLLTLLSTNSATSLFATFTCRKHIFYMFHVLSVFIRGSNSQGTATWLVKVTMFAKPSTLACVSEVFGPLNKNQPEETV